MTPSKILSTLAGVTLALAALPALAAWQCSIHPMQGASNSALTSMARVSKSKAEKIALKHVMGAAHIASSEIEAEQGCLIWSFDVKVRGHKGIQEVNIDAGNGRVLDVHHESPGQEASEG